MKIRIDPTRVSEIEDALKQVNGRATSFAVTRFDEVLAVAERAESKLVPLTQRDRVDVKIEYVPAGPSARAYRYGSNSTRLRLSRGVNGWYLTGVSREKVYPRSGEKLLVILQLGQAIRVARHALAGFVVEKPAIESGHEKIEHYVRFKPCLGSADGGLC